MSFLFTETQNTPNLDGSTTQQAGANFTTPELSPPLQQGAALPSTFLPSTQPLPFAGSVFNTALPGSPTIDANSAAIVSDLVGQWNDGAVGLHEISMAAHFMGFGAYFMTGNGQPTMPIEILSSPVDSSRNQKFSQVPVPPQAIGTASLCSAIGVWQPTTDTIWEMYLPAYNNGWMAQDGAILSDTGSGIHIPSLAGLGICGMSLWAMAIKVFELQNGVINHAVALSLPYVAPGHVGHATGDAGLSTDPRAIQTGTRFQLIPGTNISAMSALGQIVATAIETYGAFVVGTSPSLSILCEDRGQYTTDPYTSLFGGLADNVVLNNMPVTAFRVVDN